MRVVAIDGPAGSGKSTVARGVAAKLDLEYLDTGAMYRGVAWACLHAGVDPNDAPTAAAVARTTALEVSGDPTTAQMVRVDGVDVSEAIRSPEVSAAVTPVAANGEVRVELVRRQREWVAARGGGVLEGRDIATVVFPDAVAKVYLTANAEERARRRHAESAGLGLAAVSADITRRDEADSTRAVDPLQIAVGATVLDTTGKSIADVVDEIVALATRPQAVVSGVVVSGAVASVAVASVAAESLSDPTAVNPTRVPSLIGRRDRVAFAAARGLAFGFSKLWFRVSVEGLEHVPSSGAFVVAPTHRSNVDTLVLVVITKRRMRYLGKHSMWKFKPIGAAFDALGAIKVVRGTPDREAMRLCLDALRGGEPVVVFPEGQRRTGAVVEDLRDGAAYMATKIGVPILPVGIGGSEAAWGTTMKFPRFRHIHLVVGAPLPTERTSSRRAVRDHTACLQVELQQLFDRAQSRV